MKVSVVGSEDFALGFKLAGINNAYEMEEEEVQGEIDRILDSEEGVVVMESGHMESLPERKRLDIQNSVDPVVIPVGGEEEGEDLRNKIKQAIGVDLWSE